MKALAGLACFQLMLLFPCYFSMAIEPHAWLPHKKTSSSLKRPGTACENYYSPLWQENSETSYHLWSADKSISTGPAGIFIHSSGSCEHLWAFGDIVCKPDSGGYIWFSLPQEHGFISISALTEISTDVGWNVLVTEGNESEELRIFLDGKNLSDPLEPDVDISDDKRSIILSILKQILEGERWRKEIESEAERRKKAALEKTITQIGKCKNDCARKIEEQQKRKQKDPSCKNTEFASRRHFCSSGKNNKADHSESCDLGIVEQARHGPRIDILLSAKKRKVCPNEPVDSDNGKSGNASTQAPSAPHPVRSYRGRGRGRGKIPGTERAAVTTLSTPVSSITSAEEDIPKQRFGRGRGRARGCVSRTREAYIRQQPETDAGAVRVAQVALSAIKKDTTVDSREKESESKPPAVPSLQLDIQALAAQARKELTDWYRCFDKIAKYCDEVTLDKTYEEKIKQIQDKILLSKKRHINDKYHEALISDYWRLKACAAKFNHKGQDKELYLEYAKMHSEFLQEIKNIVPDEWQQYCDDVIRWVKQSK